MTNAAVSQAGPAPGPTAERVRVPLLAELLANAPSDRSRVWTDLGKAQAGLVAKLSGGRNRLIVVDLPDARRAGKSDWHLPEKVLAPGLWSEPIDIFLCWDLLNYMDAARLNELSCAMARLARSHCKVHALIHYSGTRMAEAPGLYGLEPDGQLLIQPVGSASVATPRYSPKALEKAMPALHTERTMLLNNGMQEFLFSVD